MSKQADFPQGYTVLHHAVILNREDLVDKFLTGGANPNIQTRDSCFTPLHIALKQHRRNMALRLVQGGAEVDIRDMTGVAPIDMADPELQALMDGIIIDN